MTTTAVPTGQFIDGGFVRERDGERFMTHDPSTAEPLAELPRATPADVDSAVAAARRAFETEWRHTKPYERGQFLTRVAGELRRRVSELGEIGARDSGFPRSAVERDVEATARYFEYYGGLADKIGGEVVPLGPDYLDYTQREPWGVCAVILPYNSPYQILARSLAPALAAGNTVVAKAAEQAPLGPLLLAGLLAELGLPAGVVNVVTGFGDAGARLVGHPDVDRITFTGSEATGKRVMTAAAENLTPVTLELGGKSPQIVFADADLDVAVETVIGSLLWSAGQVCSAGTRLLVERSVHGEVVEAIAQRARSARLGPAIEDPEMGPLVSEQQREKVLEAIRRGGGSGSRIVAGGAERPEGVPPGHFVAATVIDRVDPASALAHEEVFGPVLAVMDFEGTDGAIELGNATRFGLVAAVWTRDISRAHRVARELRAGQIFVNTFSAGTGIETPFGGYKASGIGREKGVTGYLEYTQVKNVCVKLD